MLYEELSDLEKWDRMMGVFTWRFYEHLDDEQYQSEEETPTDFYCIFYDTEEEKKRVIQKPFEGDVLPLEVWRKAFEGLSCHEKCSIARISPFFYKVVGADFKQLCRTFNVYLGENEAYVDAFSQVCERAFISEKAAVCNYKCAIYMKELQAIWVVSLDTNDTHTVIIPTVSPLFRQKDVTLYREGTRVMYTTDEGLSAYYPTPQLYVHDAETGRLLKRVDLRGEYPYERGNNYILYRLASSVLLFSGSTLTFHEIPVSPESKLSSLTDVGCSAQSEYFAFEDGPNTFFYDSRTRNLVKIDNYINPDERRLVARVRRKRLFARQVLAASDSYICGDLSSFHIYNVKTGQLQFKYKGKCLRVNALKNQQIFIVINDYIVVERARRQIFFYDKEDQTWKSSRTASPSVHRHLYRKAFGSELLRTSVWSFKADQIVFWGGFENFQEVVQKRYRPQPSLSSRIHEYIQWNIITPWVTWLSYYYNTYIRM